MAVAVDDFVALRRVCNDAINAGVVPGVVVLCADRGATRFFEAFGARQSEPTKLPATAETIYDVASVTKAVVTSVLTMRAVAAGAFTLDDQVARFLPDFQGLNKSSVTVRQLLCHAAGLPAHRPLYERCVLDARASHALTESLDVSMLMPDPAWRATIVRAAADEPLVGIPGAASLYSDLGFILLGSLLERVGGEPLDEQAARAIFQPLGLQATAFVDLTVDGARAQLLARGPVAPTECCPIRGRVLLGEVHDPNAWAMGGIAGHAGLFSTANDLGRVAAALCAAWRGEGQYPKGQIVPTDVIREFWLPANVPGSTWRLGWDGPAMINSQAGTRLSRQAVGHLGFTGSSLWIDPARSLWIVVQTNRVHPTVKVDPRFRILRAAIHDAAMDGLGEA
jgi:CubicO group peptidase (beta-lactamase class C family)